MSPVKDTNTSMDRAMSLKASTAGSLKTSLSSGVRIDKGGVLGAELPLEDAGVCLIVDSGDGSEWGWLSGECEASRETMGGKAELCLRADGVGGDMRSREVRREEG